MLLHELIFSAAERTPDAPALLRGNGSLEYGQLADSIGRTATGLTALGLRPGERVGVYLNKRIQAVQAYFGALHAGGVFVPINPSLKPAQVAHILRDCNVAALVTTEAQARSLTEVLGDCTDLRHLVILEAGADGMEAPRHVQTLAWKDLTAGEPGTSVRRIDTDMAAILYTSGSTGKPKGVVLSHRNMVAGALSVAEYLENTADDVILAVLPFSFDAGFSQMTTAFSVGASVVLMDYLLPRDVLKAAARYRATGLAGVPPLWTQLARLDWPEDAVQSLRYITNTGGAMPTATLGELRQRLPSTRVYLMYGLTEAFRSTYLPPEELDARPTSMGKAIPNAEIMVVREDGSPCAPGEPGELVHRGALVSLGYWNDPERTAARFRPAPNQPAGLPFREVAVWSGDTVVKDEDGFLYFVGRKDDMIKSSGYRISPTELEEVIYGTGRVNECAALGIPHFDLGQAVVIACHSEAAGDETKEAILAACRQSLPNYMVPAEIVFREALPRNPNGKIDRKRLATELEDLFQETIDR
ncbi:acyl-CoA ligase (AMP-forming), exosortase A system-associated [Lentisalinibacter salinarum]|uniref:acyl-CoA ligase (AMP-forming), exosortase A system-associated n=1 Tax=Lentisalinibacter salinarum TaxID=2992239 RepID=UPI003865FF39